MKVVLIKDWAGYKKGQEIDISDKSVIEKGLKEGIFEKPKTTK
jgi:hypothetical protein